MSDPQHFGTPPGFWDRVMTIPAIADEPRNTGNPMTSPDHHDRDLLCIVLGLPAAGVILGALITYLMQ